ncbi:MAG: hypothetical protein IKY94_14965 [Lachnospiraceae bacterium]|nr:hypothetical protein [Lachnospiraceae bacterium]
MALTDGMTGLINFKSGTYEKYTNLPDTEKANTTLFAVDENNKLYLYAGKNLIYSKIDVIDSVAGDSLLPVTSRAVYNYMTSALEVIDGTTKGIVDEDMVPGRFYYYEDGTLKFKYGLSQAPLTIQTGNNITVESTYIPTDSNPINGIGVSEALNTIFSSVSSLPASGYGETEKIYCLTTTNSNGDVTSSDLYYYPSTSSSAVKIATGDGFLLTSPTSAQVIEEDLILSSGNLTLATGKILTVDTIQKASTETSDKIKLNGDSLIIGSLNITDSLISMDATATNITANTLLKTLNLEVDGTITNGTIFSTSMAIEGGAAAQLKLNTAAEFYFGINYYLKPDSINLPGGTITSGLTISSGNLAVSTGAISADDINITNAFMSEIDADNMRWVTLKNSLAFDSAHNYYIDNNGIARLNSITSSAMNITGKTTLDSLEVTTDTNLNTILTVNGKTILSNEIATNYFDCTLNEEGISDKMIMSKPLYFSSGSYIDTTGAAVLGSISGSSLTVSGNVALNGTTKLTTITDGYTFGT